MSFDRSRFIYALAGSLIADEWALDRVKDNIAAAMGNPFVRTPKLAARILAGFATKPTFEQLANFLHADPGLARTISRSWAMRLRRSRRRKPAMDDPPAKLRGIALPRLVTEFDVAKWLEIDPQRLRWHADVAGRNQRHPDGPLRLYRYRWIPRRGRFPRLLEIPKLTLKRMQRKILAEILDAVPVHPAAHGFVAGRSILTNAAAHCGKATVLRFDLTDFFPSITSTRVFRIFRTIGYPERVARLLTGLCTTQLPADVWEARPGAREGAEFVIRQHLITRHLPQGAPTSPALANLAAHRMDRRLSGLARAAGAAYTRYADDITFSGEGDLARSRKPFGAHVAVIAQEEGFSLNFRKTRILRAGVRQHVTGVVVNAHPNIARPDFDRLKAILTNCVRHGPESQNRATLSDFRSHLAGKVSHMASINPARGEKLRAILRQIRWNSGDVKEDVR